METTMNSLDFLRLFDKVCTAQNALIIGHRRPDGDCVGSAAALAHLLRCMGRRAEILFPDPVPKRLAFLLGGLSVRPSLPDDLETRQILCVDVASPDQLGALAEPLAGRVYLRIDHHDVGNPYAQFEFVRAEAAAVGEIIFDLCERAAALELIPAIPSAAVAAAYGAVSSDTGCFKYSNVTPGTHFRAARMIAAGTPAASINLQLFDTKEPGQLRAESIVQSSIELYEDGRVAAVVIDRDCFSEELAYTDFDTAVDIVRSVRGVRAAIVVKATDEAGVYRVSLRGNNQTRVSEIAAAFGGGGHISTAGCTIHAKDGREALKMLLKEIRTSGTLDF